MNKKIRRKAYELYKLDWMSSNGKTLTEMIEKLEEYQISLNSKDINLQELFKIWEEKIGFGGEIYNSYEDFIKKEYNDKSYIYYLFSHSNISDTDVEKFFNIYKKDVDINTH